MSETRDVKNWNNIHISLVLKDKHLRTNYLKQIFGCEHFHSFSKRENSRTVTSSPSVPILLSFSFVSI